MVSQFPALWAECPSETYNAGKPCKTGTQMPARGTADSAAAECEYKRWERDP
jgi:hypothetical protein